jgi:DNA-directed RNA polymerase sigma subunit (sigma70/sigma32)
MLNSNFIASSDTLAGSPKLEEVAKQINVTRERVRQREIKTLSKLRRIAARKKVRY